MPGTSTDDRTLASPELADRRARPLELLRYDLASDRAARRIAELGSAWAALFVDPDSNTIGVLRYR